MIEIEITEDNIDEVVQKLIDDEDFKKECKNNNLIDSSTGEIIDEMMLFSAINDKYRKLLVFHEKTNMYDNCKRKVDMAIIETIKMYDRKLLEIKNDNNTINSYDYLRLMAYRFGNLKAFSNNRIVKFHSFSNINAIEKPANLSVLNYGRFCILCSMKYKTNEIRHSNGRPLKDSILMKALEIETEYTYNAMIRDLIRENMIAITKTNKFECIMLNPAYVASSREITLTEYEIFSDTLKLVLSKEIIKYYELCLSERKKSIIYCDIESFEYRTIDDKLQNYTK